MTLNQMYGWIRENFAFYRTGDQCWQVATNVFVYFAYLPSTEWGTNIGRFEI